MNYKAFLNHILPLVGKEVPRQAVKIWRRELNGTIAISVRSKEQNTILLNRTAGAIFLACDGNNNIFSIIMAFSEAYPDIDHEVIASDVIRTIRLLEGVGVLRSLNLNHPTMGSLEDVATII